MPGSITAHGLSCNVDPCSVDVEFGFKGMQQFENGFEFANPRPGSRLWGQNKCRMFRLNLRGRPCVSSAQARARDLLEVILADAPRAMQPQDQRIRASLVVTRRNEETIRH